MLDGEEGSAGPEEDRRDGPEGECGPWGIEGLAGTFLSATAPSPARDCPSCGTRVHL